MFRGTPEHPDARGQRPRRARTTSAFSLLELVMVVVVIGTVGAIAVPRMASATENAKAESLEASRVTFQKALDLYVEEHGGLNANQGPDGSAGNDLVAFVRRMTSTSDGLSNPDAQGIYGPYLREIPRNPYAATQTVRFDGPTTPQNRAWRFDTATNTIVPDQGQEVKIIRGGKHVKVGTFGVTVGGGGEDPEQMPVGPDLGI
ncbi:MAG: hypothetical protein ACKVS8_01815 [Phycisphaerales bacterium]